MLDGLVGACARLSMGAPRLVVVVFAVGMGFLCWKLTGLEVDTNIANRMDEGSAVREGQAWFEETFGSGGLEFTSPRPSPTASTRK